MCHTPSEFTRLRPFQYCNHVSDCKVQCVIVTRNLEMTEWGEVILLQVMWIGSKGHSMETSNLPAHPSQLILHSLTES